jgi:hypothetical protein
MHQRYHTASPEGREASTRTVKRNLRTQELPQRGDCNLPAACRDSIQGVPLPRVLRAQTIAIYFRCDQAVPLDPGNPRLRTLEVNCHRLRYSLGVPGFRTVAWPIEAHAREV